MAGVDVTKFKQKNSNGKKMILKCIKMKKLAIKNYIN